MKKITALILAMIMVISLAACGQASPAAEAPAAAPAAPAPAAPAPAPMADPFAVQGTASLPAGEDDDDADLPF